MAIGAPAPRPTATMGIVQSKPFKSVAPKTDTPDTYRMTLDEALARTPAMPTMLRQTSNFSDTSKRSTCSASSDDSAASSSTPRNFLARLLRR